MKGYIITIVCVIIVGAVLEILTPEGEFKKYIKPILGIMIVLIIAKPLLCSINLENNFNFFENTKTSEAYYTDMYKNNVLLIFSQKLEDTIKSYLESKGFRVSECHVTSVYENGNAKISKVSISSNSNSLFIKEILNKQFGIDKGCITLY